MDRTEEFMDDIRCIKLKAPSNDKSDTTIQIHDHRTVVEPKPGFGIESNLGHNPTLLNPGKTTNFIYKLNGNVTEDLIKLINGTFNLDFGEDKKKVTPAASYRELVSAGIELQYAGTECTVLEDNLRLISYVLPEVVAEMLKLHYVENVSVISDQVKILTERNILKYRNVEDHAYYEYMIKKLLASCALGMQSATPWSGKEDTSGGYDVVKRDGEVHCQYFYDRNDFEDYLVRHTRLDTPSTSRYEFSKIYKDAAGDYYTKLNLQICFT